MEAHFPREARAGYHYGVAAISPERVRISGRIDRIKRVVQVVADATALEQGGGIDNEFTLSARDADNNPVDGVTMDVQHAHVTVPIQEDPYSKILSISPIFNDQPLPGFRITRVDVDPRQVRVAGRPELIDTLSTLSTEEIETHDMTDSQQVSIPLVIPKGVVVRDSSGNQITKVRVSITVERVVALTPTTPSGQSQQ